MSKAILELNGEVHALSSCEELPISEGLVELKRACMLVLVDYMAQNNLVVDEDDGVNSDSEEEEVQEESPRKKQK